MKPATTLALLEAAAFLNAPIDPGVEVRLASTVCRAPSPEPQAACT